MWILFRELAKEAKRSAEGFESGVQDSSFIISVENVCVELTANMLRFAGLFLGQFYVVARVLCGF